MCDWHQSPRPFKSHTPHHVKLSALSPGHSIPRPTTMVPHDVDLVFVMPCPWSLVESQTMKRCGSFSSSGWETWIIRRPSGQHRTAPGTPFTVPSLSSRLLRTVHLGLQSGGALLHQRLAEDDQKIRYLPSSPERRQVWLVDRLNPYRNNTAGTPFSVRALFSWLLCSVRPSPR